MKNVAKCDTWCELQNPVNHRVFERKLRPKPSGRGHVCLGVTHRASPPPAGGGKDDGLPRPGRGAAGLKREPAATSCGGDWWWTRPRAAAVCIAPRTHAAGAGSSDPDVLAESTEPLRPQVRRGYPLSLSISISGGKETYKDSPSNGERTGKSPALKSGGLAVRIVVWRSVLCGGPGPSPLERGAREGESPVVPGPCRTTRRCRRVGLFGNAAPSGR